MGTSVSKRLLMLAFLIAPIILSVLKVDLKSKYNPVTVRSIVISDVIEQSPIQFHEPNSSRVENSTLNVRPSNQSFSAIRIRGPNTLRVENVTYNMPSSNQSFPPIRIQEPNASQVENSTLKVPPPNPSFPAIRIQEPKTSRVENSTRNVPHPNPSFPAIRIQEPKTSRADNSTLNMPPSNASFPTDFETKAIKSYQPKGTSLWIHVEEFSEGMATWRISFAEILMVAKRLNATVVEPCIEDGRLRTCRVAKYRLGQVYDLRRLRQFHPHIVSYDAYQTMLAVENPIIVSTCLQFPRGTPSPSKVCGNVTNMYQEKVNGPLERALQYNNYGTTVIHIMYYRQGGFLNTKVGPKRLVLPRFIEPIITDHFEFESQHYDSVDYLLRLMGISNNSDFDVIHWRAEKPDINYDDCASKILQARKAMGSKTTVLLSSINLQVDRQWFDPRRYNQSDAIRGLNRLLDSGFHKLDQVLDKVQNMIPDQIVIPVWDQIIAQKARRFATCTKGCPKRQNLCVACNFLGNFAQTAVNLRRQSGKASDECWPI